MNDATTSREREELRRLLDAFGGDRARWPELRVAALDALLQRDEASRALLAEARRLDAMLDRAVLDRAAAPLAGPAVARLADRIVAAAVAERAAAAASSSEMADGKSRVIPWPAPAPRQAREVQLRAPRANGSRLRIAGMLAASLAIGVFAGARDILPASPIVSAIEARLERDSGPLLAQAQSDLLTTFEEDLL